MVISNLEKLLFFALHFPDDTEGQGLHLTGK